MEGQSLTVSKGYLYSKSFVDSEGHAYSDFAPQLQHYTNSNDR